MAKEIKFKSGDKLTCIALENIGTVESGKPIDVCKEDKLKIGKQYTASIDQRRYQGINAKDSKVEAIRLVGLKHTHRASNFELAK